MAVDKSLLSGSTTMMILKLVQERDMYGYQMIEELRHQSNDVFALKAGTLYPILHALEKEGKLISYEEGAEGSRIRMYYHITKKGKSFLVEKQDEWATYTVAVNNILKGGVTVATV